MEYIYPKNKLFFKNKNFDHKGTINLRCHPKDHWILIHLKILKS